MSDVEWMACLGSGIAGNNRTDEEFNENNFLC
jgi:hypothetical protein